MESPTQRERLATLYRLAIDRTLQLWEIERRIEAEVDCPLDNLRDAIDDVCAGIDRVEQVKASTIDELILGAIAYNGIVE